ncbi:unnamed protein product [Phaedon cochleariae]|uniref:MMS19 nucleotide excision repair protein n=1 Tax=Phaedon cochleariae TaxID=80249 RepID=A0A9P0DLE5_PHACE|nr:unnamed protein product [Phaedon cochleariae]
MEQFQDIDDEHFSEKCSIVAKDIQRGDLTVLSLIENLGSLLTDTSATKRELGIAVLSEVLNKIPSNCLNAQELSVISSFYAEKLKDLHQVVPPSLKGILTIIEFENFPGQKVAVLLNALFHNVSCQQQQQADRNTIYRIFDLMSRRFSTELISMKLEFVYGVLQSIDGERDPRNLLFLFKWLKTFLGLVSLGHLAEDFFEVLACYFPVDFRAPPSEKGITRDVLADALLPCLTAVPDFGEFCIPLALEKLDSSLKIAKLDSLKLLIEGCRTFDSSLYLEKAPEISSQLQKEIFSNPTSDIKSLCLETMTATINKISSQADACEDISRNIVDTLKANLIPDSRFYQPSEDILYHVALASENSSKCVAKEIVPVLANMYVITSTMDKKLFTLRTLVKITKAYLKYHTSLNTQEIPDIAKVPILCVEAMNSNGISRKIGCDSLTAMVQNLPQEVRLKLYQYLRTGIHSPSENADLKKSELECLKNLASHYPSEVKLNVFEEDSKNSSILNSLTILVNLKEFRDFVIEHFINFLQNVETIPFTLDSMKDLLEREQSNKELIQAFLDKNLLDILIALALREDLTATLPNVSRILKLLIGPLDVSLQNEILERHLKVVYEKSARCHIYLIVLDGLVSALRRDIQVCYEVLELALEISLLSQDGDVQKVAVQLLANLINKRNDDEVFNLYLDEIQNVCLTSIKNDNLNIDPILTMFWITKALVMRNSAKGILWLDYVLKLLDEHNEAVEGLEIIMKDDYESLSSACHCNKLLIYRQKMFVYITNRIAEKYSTNKLFYSKATACLLKHTPSQAINMQYKKISKLILLCLETDEESENLNILLKIIKDTLLNDSALIEDHLEDYLTRILRLTSFKNSMQVRIKAIQCLVHFTSLFPLYKLIPFKSKVLQCLSDCIDDRKRLVRREAVEARSLWFLMDAPI